ncbi:hypothetical protein ACJIZ3_019323 [Penstemon smallii]|uniref:HMG box domain-containing protein n=1 Tax=Penstemon smallii TaxID=265156 RepID=A0ABD3T1J8_9LAMI
MKGGKSKADTKRGDSRLAVKKQTKKERQAAKDPNKPKRPPSAFFVFMEDFRKQYKEKHPNNKSVAAVGKAGGEKWKSLSAEDKAPFVAKAEKRKEEYERKMEAYNRKLAGGDDDESDKSKSEVDEEGSGEMKGARSKADSKRGDSRLAVKKQTKKERNAAKDPNKPKRPPSAFFVFMEDFRKQYKEKHPNNKSVAAVGKAGGEKWKSLSVEDKAPFVAEAEKRKEEYERKMEAYNRKLAGEGDDESDKSKSEVHDEDDDEDGSGEMRGGKSKADSKRGDSRLAVKKQTKKEKNAAKDPNKPKRPPSAFFVFMEDFRKQYKEKHPSNKSVAVVGKAGGEKWKSLSDAEKAPFVAKAAKRKEEYEGKMDSYNRKLAGEGDDESDKSKSEVHDEDDDEDGSGEEDEDDD